MEYVIKWKYKHKESSGQGSPSSNKNSLDEWAKKMNIEYPEIHHWVEEWKS